MSEWVFLFFSFFKMQLYAVYTFDSKIKIVLKQQDERKCIMQAATVRKWRATLILSKLPFLDLNLSGASLTVLI